MFVHKLAICHYVLTTFDDLRVRQENDASCKMVPRAEKSRAYSTLMILAISLAPSPPPFQKALTGSLPNILSNPLF